MTGILRTSLPGFQDLDAAAALRATARLGLGRTVFSSVAELSPTLDALELAGLRHLAAELGVALGASADFINPLSARGRCNAVYGNGDLSAGVMRLVEAAQAIGVDDLFFMAGKIEDRFDAVVPWSDQLAALAAFLADLAPRLRDCGARLLLKTHEEITTFEILRLVEAAGADMLGVALDPVNVLCRMEDPVAATRRVAPYVTQVHLDDAVLRFEAGGMRRFLCPLGEGVIDWPAILALVPRATPLLEFHSGQFAMPVFDAGWRSAQPDMTLDEYAAVLGAAASLPPGYEPVDQVNSTGRLPAALRWLERRQP